MRQSSQSKGSVRNGAAFACLVLPDIQPSSVIPAAKPGNAWGDRNPEIFKRLKARTGEGLWGSLVAISRVKMRSRFLSIFS